jgi:hypothetical protein
LEVAEQGVRQDGTMGLLALIHNLLQLFLLVVVLVDEAPRVLLAVLVGLVEGLQEVLGLVERVTHHFAHPLKAIMVPLVPNLLLSMAAVAGVVLVRLVQSV